MNNYGFVLEELGIDLMPLVREAFAPLAKLVFSEWGGGSIDSVHAFTISYSTLGDRDLDRHMDQVARGFSGFRRLNVFPPLLSVGGDGQCEPRRAFLRRGGVLQRPAGLSAGWEGEKCIRVNAIYVHMMIGPSDSQISDRFSFAMTTGAYNLSAQAGDGGDPCGAALARRPRAARGREAQPRAMAPQHKLQDESGPRLPQPLRRDSRAIRHPQRALSSASSSDQQQA
eukprot:scaffold217190_cov38-Prasinocladus_malaysianus.AAC.1